MTDIQPEQYPQPRTYEQAVFEGDAGMRAADIFPGAEDWDVPGATEPPVATVDEPAMANDFTQGPEPRPEGDTQ